jgi:UDP:flavonoid glycosyltransferase YjiC (YdhE family)
MRVLAIASPMVGHVLPLIPLARAFRDAGHDVLFGTAHEGVEAVRKAGVQVEDVAPGLNVSRVLLGALIRRPLMMRREMAGTGGTTAVGRMFAPMGERMADRTVRLADDWRPDLVLHEGLAPLGALVAARRGVPARRTSTSSLVGTASTRFPSRRTRLSPSLPAWAASGSACRCDTCRRRAVETAR